MAHSQSQSGIHVDERSKLLLFVDEEPLHHQEPPPPSTARISSSDGSVFLPHNEDSTLIWTVIPTVLIGIFVANADSSLIIASSQQLASEFNALSSASWLITSYWLAQCAAQPLYGKLSTIFGRKNNLIYCNLIFALGCLICAIGKQYWQILAGRALSGIGGAGMTALVSLIIAVPVRKIAAWRSFVNVVATMGRSLGGPIGGWLTNTVGWRWSFLGQVPLTLFGLILIMWKLPNSIYKQQESESKPTFSQRVKRVDMSGAIALALSICSFLLTLDFVTRPSPWYIVMVMAVVTLVLCLVFYMIERYRAAEPILPIILLTKRVAWTSYVVTGLQMAAQFSVFYATPIYFQIAAGVSVTNAGSRLVPAVVGNVIGGVLCGILVSRTARYKAITVTASTAATLGYILMIIHWTGSTSWLEAQYILLGGFGSGVIQSTTFVHLASGLDQEDLAIAGTTLYLSQNVFGLVGIQIATAVLHGTLTHRLGQDLQGVPNKQQVIKQALSNINSIRSLPEAVRDLVVRAYINSLRCSYGVSVVFAFIGILFALSIREGKL